MELDRTKSAEHPLVARAVGLLRWLCLVAAVVLLNLTCVASAAWVVIPRPHDPAREANRDRAMTIRSAAVLYFATEGKCPKSAGLLVSEGVLAEGMEIHDTRGHPYRIECSEADIVVTADGVALTE